MKILITLIVAVSCFAQSTAVFPRRVATNSDLFVASNNYSSTLTVGVSSSATTLTVASTSGFTAPGVVTIDNEVIAVCSVTSGTTFRVGSSACPNIDGRGYDGTSGVAHIATRTVQGRVIARLHNQMAAEVKAIETKLNTEAVSVKDFGCVGDGVANDTACLQAALAASTGGQRLYCPPGVYLHSAALYLPSFISFVGPHGDLLGPNGGCTLKWAGAAPATAFATGSAMVMVHAVEGTNMEGINLDGSNTARLTGYMQDANAGAGGITQRNAYRYGALTHFGNAAADVVGAAMNFGSDGIFPTEQVDGVEVSSFSISDAYIGVRISNVNFAYSKFSRFVMIDINKGFDVRISGYHIVEQGALGRMLGTNPAVVNIAGPHGTVFYNQIQAEADTSLTMNAKMFNIDASAGYGTDSAPIYVNSTIFGFPSTIGIFTQNIISKGNYGSVSYPVTISNYRVNVTSEGDTDMHWVISPGYASNVKVVGLPDDYGSIAEFETNLDGSNTLPIAKFGVRYTSASDTEPFNLYCSISTVANGPICTSSAQKWKLAWSTTGFGIRDLTAANFRSFWVDSGLSGNAGVRVHQTNTEINGNILNTSGGAEGRLYHYFSSQAGVNGAITVTSADGTYQPAAGHIVCVELTANTLIGASANSIQFNGGAVIGILSGFNGANIATGYNVGTTFCGILGAGGIMRDMRQ
jgi:hypothetical protein